MSGSKFPGSLFDISPSKSGSAAGSSVGDVSSASSLPMAVCHSSGSKGPSLALETFRQAELDTTSLLCPKCKRQCPVPDAVSRGKQEWCRRCVATYKS